MGMGLEVKMGAGDEVKRCKALCTCTMCNTNTNTIATNVPPPEVAAIKWAPKQALALRNTWKNIKNRSCPCLQLPLGIINSSEVGQKRWPII